MLVLIKALVTYKIPQFSKSLMSILGEYGLLVYLLLFSGSMSTCLMWKNIQPKIAMYYQMLNLHGLNLRCTLMEHFGWKRRFIGSDRALYFTTLSSPRNAFARKKKCYLPSRCVPFQGFDKFMYVQTSVFPAQVSVRHLVWLLWLPTIWSLPMKSHDWCYTT